VRSDTPVSFLNGFEKEQIMNIGDIRKMTSLSDDARQALTAAFDAMAKWRDEISATNDRCLPKLLDQMTALQRAMGWPPHWSAAGREHLLKASQMQTQMIDQIMDTWEQTLKSPGALQGATMLPTAGSSVPGSDDPMKDMIRLWEQMFPPFKFWMQAAEVYQRQLMNMDPGLAERRTSPYRRVA
jgi:hypothetical protein